jgi:flavin-dependent dehydrogenase
VTVDYRAFCQAMLAQTDAEVWQARAMSYAGGVITTTRGAVHARFVVDAAGWRSLYGHNLRLAAARYIGYGIETELPVRLGHSPGLHFYVEKRIVRKGYAWVFPCGSATRFGVGAFEDRAQLRRLLEAFLERLWPAARRDARWGSGDPAA